MALRHMYRSKQLTTLLNHLGHCESHSFSLEVETAIAKAVEQASSLLSSQIVRQPDIASLFHSEFDNFDQLVNTEGGSIHTAHGIMMQELLKCDDREDPGGMGPDLPAAERTKERSFTETTQETLADCYVSQRKSPPYKLVIKLLTGCEGSMIATREIGIIWVFLR